MCGVGTTTVPGSPDDSSFSSRDTSQDGAYLSLSISYAVSAVSGVDANTGTGTGTPSAPGLSVKFGEWRERKPPPFSFEPGGRTFGMEALPPSRCDGQTPAVELRKRDLTFGIVRSGGTEHVTYRRCGASDDQPFVETEAVSTLTVH